MRVTAVASSKKSHRAAAVNTTLDTFSFAPTAPQNNLAVCHAKTDLRCLRHSGSLQGKILLISVQALALADCRRTRKRMSCCLFSLEHKLRKTVGNLPIHLMNSKPQSQIAPPTPAFTVAAGVSRIGRTPSVVGDELLVKISSHDTNGAFAVAEGRTPVMGGPPLHRHFIQDEWWYIIEGQFLFEVDVRRYTLDPEILFFRHVEAAIRFRMSAPCRDVRL